MKKITRDRIIAITVIVIASVHIVWVIYRIAIVNLTNDEVDRHKLPLYGGLFMLDSIAIFTMIRKLWIERKSIQKKS